MAGPAYGKVGSSCFSGSFGGGPSYLISHCSVAEMFRSIARPGPSLLPSAFPIPTHPAVLGVAFMWVVPESPCCSPLAQPNTIHCVRMMSVIVQEAVE